MLLNTPDTILLFISSEPPKIWASLLPLNSNLALIIPTGTVLNLILEGPDHKEEVDAKHPSKNATDDVYEDEANEGSQDVEDVKDEADSS